MNGQGREASTTRVVFVAIALALLAGIFATLRVVSRTTDGQGAREKHRQGPEQAPRLESRPDRDGVAGRLVILFEDDRGNALSGVRSAVVPWTGGRKSGDVLHPTVLPRDAARYTLDGITPGPYRISAVLDDHLPLIGSELAVPTEIATQSYEVSIVLPRLGVLRGLVLDADGRGVPSAVVRIDRGGVVVSGSVAPGRRAQTATTDSSGKFAISGIVPGVGVEWEVSDDAHPTTNGVLPRFSPGEVRDETLTLLPATSLIGSTLVQSDTSNVGVLLYSLDRSQSMGEAMTTPDSAGNFRFTKVGPGAKAVVSVERSPHLVLIRFARADVQAGTVTDVGLLTAARGPAIRLTVSAQAPVPAGAHVRLVSLVWPDGAPRETHIPFEVVVDLDTDIAIVGLPAGSFSTGAVLALGRDGAPALSHRSANFRVGNESRDRGAQLLLRRRVPTGRGITVSIDMAPLDTVPSEEMLPRVVVMRDGRVLGGTASPIGRGVTSWTSKLSATLSGPCEFWCLSSGFVCGPIQETLAAGGTYSVRFARWRAASVVEMAVPPDGAGAHVGSTYFAAYRDRSTESEHPIPFAQGSGGRSGVLRFDCWPGIDVWVEVLQTNEGGGSDTSHRVPGKELLPGQVTRLRIPRPGGGK